VRPTYKTLLCATDLSAVGNAALPVTYALAGKGSTVHVLTVVEATNGNGARQNELALGSSKDDAGGRSDLERARLHLNALCAAHPAQEGVETVVHVAPGWDAALVIEDLARSVGADVVVLGTHGRTGFGRLLMGSVAAEVLRRRRIPVLLLHDVLGREAQERAHRQAAPR
jgi:nucleotide-binding universal stress UspA family protein